MKIKCVNTAQVAGVLPVYLFLRQGPESENLRRESKLVVPDRNIEPAITSVGYVPDVSIKHKPELKDGALALSMKGTIRFTRYEDSSR
jgi:hypothetical protein